MSRFKKELDGVRPADALVADTLRRMHEENARLQSAKAEADAGEGVGKGEGKGESESEQAPKAARSPLPFMRRRAFRWAAAAAACLLLCGTLFAMRQAERVPMARLSAAAAPQAVAAGNRGQGGQQVKERTVSDSEFSARIGFDAETYVPAYVCTSKKPVFFVDGDGTVLGDYGVYAYEKATDRVTAYLSTSDTTAPVELVYGEATRCGQTDVRFGRTEDGAVYYAAWVQNGTSVCLRSETLRERAFVKLVQSILG